ncbi:Systemin receptor SR160 (Brassinosteroid LRR receptor kinase) [Durusdinium trenchii]|uniref:Systemin receptor SR160 (Brassinosteroid LRR receptor kinase) n=1 Tax=Durusdinium trenchii TaxID=1381693 RepID=A0ABP0QHY4_9DINO
MLMVLFWSMGFSLRAVWTDISSMMRRPDSSLGAGGAASSLVCSQQSATCITTIHQVHAFLPQDRPGHSSTTMQLTQSGGPAGTPGFMCKRYVETGKFNDKSEVYSIGVTIVQVITGKTDFDDDFLSDLIEEANAEFITQKHDQRVLEDAEILKKLSAMAAASVERYAKRIQVMPLLRQARDAAATVSTGEIPALNSQVEQMAAELRRWRLREEAAQAALN